MVVLGAGNFPVWRLRRNQFCDANGARKISTAPDGVKRPPRSAFSKRRSLEVAETPCFTHVMALPPVAVAILDDLLFTAKIRETARIIGVELTVVRDPSVLHQGPPPALLLLDLNARKVDPFAALDVVRKRPDEGRTVRAVAFAASVDKALAQRARDAGVESILDRAELTEQLPEILRSVTRAPVAID